jgi:hypothetical protein
MSNKLAFSSAVSVLMMAIFVLFSGDAVRVPLGPQVRADLAGAAEQMLPSAKALLQVAR